MSEKEENASKMSLKNITLIVAAVVVIFAVGAAVYFYMQYYQAQLLLKNPTLAAAQQTNQLIAQVGKLMQLPAESPTIATVSDVSKLQDQPFFQDAQNGDKVLIYTKARKAILYRPSTNKIIDVAPVNLGATQTISPTPEVSPKVTPKPTGIQSGPTKAPTP